MATTGYLGQGTILSRSATIPYDAMDEDAIGQVQSITGPTQSRDLIDVTNHSSTGSYREFINGLKDGGDLTFEVIYDPGDASIDLLRQDFDSGNINAWRIEFPDNPGTHGTWWTFSGLVTNFSVAIPTDDAVKLNCTIKVTGAIGITAAA
jgi:predicted secreted protein